MVARSAQHFRIAPEEESDRTAVRALGAGVQNSAVFCARSVSTSVRSRRRCPADTFGATFWCQKVVNPLLAGDAESKVRNFPKESKNRFHFFLCFWLDPKAPKDQARRKAAGDDTRSFRSAIPQTEAC